jgi:hypothetical protein
LNPTANDASAVRDQRVSPDMTKYRSYSEIVEEKLEMNVPKIDRTFGQWFDQQGLPGPGAVGPCQIIKGPEQRGLPMRAGHREPREYAAHKTQRGVAR